MTIEKTEYETSHKLQDEGEIQIAKERMYSVLLHTGNYFGEVALITRLKRTATVEAVKHCTLSTLSRQAL